MATSIILKILYYIMDAYSIVLILDCILSWFNGARATKWGNIIHTMSNAYMGRFRGILVLGFLDFTPILGFFVFDGIIALLGMLI